MVKKIKTKKDDIKELLDLQKETVKLLKEAVELLKNNVHYHFHNEPAPYVPYISPYNTQPNTTPVPTWPGTWPNVTCKGDYTNSVPVTASHKAEFVTGMSTKGQYV